MASPTQQPLAEGVNSALQTSVLSPRGLGKLEAWDVWLQAQITCGFLWSPPSCTLSPWVLPALTICVPTTNPRPHTRKSQIFWFPACSTPREMLGV